MDWGRLFQQAWFSRRCYAYGAIDPCIKESCHHARNLQADIQGNHLGAERAIKDKFGHWEFSLPISQIFTNYQPSKKKVHR